MAKKGRIQIDGHHFHSEHEYKRYLGLKELVKKDRLERLEVKPTFPLIVNDQEVDYYTPTFQFFDPATNRQRVIQVMGGSNNPLLELRIKLFEALYPYPVERWG